MSVESNVSPKPKFWLANMLGPGGGTLAVIQSFTIASNEECARHIIEESCSTDGLRFILVNVYPLELLGAISPEDAAFVLQAARFLFVNPDRSRSHLPVHKEVNRLLSSRKG